MPLLLNQKSSVSVACNPSGAVRVVELGNGRATGAVFGSLRGPVHVVVRDRSTTPLGAVSWIRLPANRIRTSSSRAS